MSLTNTFYLVPAPDKCVRDPITGLALPAEGASKPKSAYWLRRVRDGSVKEASPAPTASPALQAAEDAEQAAEKAVAAAKAAEKSAASTSKKGN